MTEDQKSLHTAEMTELFGPLSQMTRLRQRSDQRMAFLLVMLAALVFAMILNTLT